MFRNILGVISTLMVVGIGIIVFLMIFSGLTTSFETSFNETEVETNVTSDLIGIEEVFSGWVGIVPLIGVVIFLGLVMGIMVAVFSSFGRGFGDGLGSSSYHDDDDDDDNTKSKKETKNIYTAMELKSKDEITEDDIVRSEFD